MKKTNLFTMLISVAAVVALIIVGACTKEGPAGPPGENGTDGNATCGVCHNNTADVETKIDQWAASRHANGGTNFENAAGCAPCHTSQGFKEVIVTDTTACAAAIEDPANISCYTCHKIHDTYAVADWDLRKTAATPSWLAKTTNDLGTANLCAQCHQPRISYKVPDVTQPDGIYTVTSTRFGPHHGPQSSTLTGTAFYMVGSGYNNSSHLGIENACVTCHMSSAMGYYAGGHTFKVYSDEEGAFNLVGCTPCHTEEEAQANIDEFTVTITDLMTQLGTKLVAAGIYNPAGTSGYAVKGDYTNRVAGAYWNFITIIEDKSTGIHNPKFVQKILENSIADLP
jgi:hypothetical protein